MVLKIFGKKFKRFETFFLENFGYFGEYWKIVSYNFQSKRPIMTLGGVHGL